MSPESLTGGKRRQAKMITHICGRMLRLEEGDGTVLHEKKWDTEKNIWRSTRGEIEKQGGLDVKDGDLKRGIVVRD
jgi:hypothetical protein